MANNRYADPARATRRWITAGLVFGGALAGVALGIALTPLGKMVAGAPPADTANYIRNAVAFGIMGACVGPVVTWLALRNSPFWRIVLEPLVGCVVGASVGVLLGSAVLFLALIPVGGAVAAGRLALVHRERRYHLFS